MHAYGVRRLAIVDFDVHHGNGTEEAFAGDDRVLMCSFFQHPFFPNSGAEQPAANMANVPVPAYTDGAAVRALVRDVWLPPLEAHEPELVLVSAGRSEERRVGKACVRSFRSRGSSSHYTNKSIIISTNQNIKNNSLKST